MLRSSIALAAGSLLLLALAVACGSSNMPTTPSPVPGGGAANVTITITGMNGGQSFSPSPASIPAGQTVAWRNADSITHTATADNGAFDTGSISPGATSSPITMGTAGSFGYHCRIHPSMVGTVTAQ
jgi:plastocyanin